MGRQSRYPKEFRERAVRLVYEWRDARERTDGGFKEVAELGVHLETVRNWVNQAEIDAGALECGVTQHLLDRLCGRGPQRATLAARRGGLDATPVAIVF